MKLKDIKIPKEFMRTTPSPMKLASCETYYKEHGELHKPIIVNKDGILVDGYVRYLVAQKLNLEDVPTTESQDIRIYVQGRHTDGGKDYWWKVQKQHEAGFINKVKIGDKIVVSTKKGHCPIIITDIKMSNEPPINQRIRVVVRY